MEGNMRPFVIAISASSGNVRALKNFIQAIPSNGDISLIVIVHLLSDRSDIINDIVAWRTNLPMTLIEDGGALAPDHIHVLPQDCVLAIENGQFKVTKTLESTGNIVDICFSSLAKDQGDHAVGIMLDGKENDGILGIGAIKRHGGLVIVPDVIPMTFHCPAPESGYFILPIQDIPAYLMKYIQSFKMDRRKSRREKDKRLPMPLTRDRLQSVIKDYEIALEDLKSANEKMVLISEELQSTNEELRISQEGIQSVNEELNSKREEIDQANSDMKNLFESTKIPVIFLDNRLSIRIFTPAATEIFKLLPCDRGRPLMDIASAFDCPDFLNNIKHVLESHEPIERRIVRRDGKAHYFVRILPYLTSVNDADGVVISFIDVTIIVQAEEHQKMLVAELNHRIRNILSVVIALGEQTISKDPSKESVKKFLERIYALSRTYTLLSEENWHPVPLTDIAMGELKPYAITRRERFIIEGPSVLLEPKAALAFGMVFHELATNAAKYGALSTEEGCVQILWSLQENDQRLVVQWIEEGGPSVQNPTRQGFGTSMISQEINYGLNGHVDIKYDENGFHARIEVPSAVCASMENEGGAAYGT
jgi:two-component sensor histidine kinase